MDLCTVISEGFIPQALNLIQSYKILSYDQNIYLYYFNTDRQKLNIFTELFGDKVKLIEVKNVCDHALSPRIFFYKVYAIKDCLENHSNGFIYSDSANCFVREAKNIHDHLIDDSMFLREELGKVSPDIELKQSIEIGGDTVEVEIPMTVNFFWPAAGK